MLGVVGEFGSGFPVDEELEMVSPHSDTNIVPLPPANVLRFQCTADIVGLRLALLVDHQSCAAGTGVFLAPGKVKIPRAENMRTDTDVAEIGVVTFEGAFAAKIGPAA